MPNNYPKKVKEKFSRSFSIDLTVQVDFITFQLKELVIYVCVDIRWLQVSIVNGLFAKLSTNFQKQMFS